MQTEDQTERRTNMTKLIDAIYDYAKAPKSPRIKPAEEL